MIIKKEHIIGFTLSSLNASVALLVRNNNITVMINTELGNGVLTVPLKNKTVYGALQDVSAGDWLKSVAGENMYVYSKKAMEEQVTASINKALSEKRISTSRSSDALGSAIAVIQDSSSQDLCHYHLMEYHFSDLIWPDLGMIPTGEELNTDFIDIFNQVWKPFLAYLHTETLILPIHSEIE